MFSQTDVIKFIHLSLMGDGLSKEAYEQLLETVRPYPSLAGIIKEYTVVHNNMFAWSDEAAKDKSCRNAMLLAAIADKQAESS